VSARAVSQPKSLRPNGLSIGVSQLFARAAGCSLRDTVCTGPTVRTWIAGAWLCFRVTSRSSNGRAGLGSHRGGDHGYQRQCHCSDNTNANQIAAGKVRQSGRPGDFIMQQIGFVQLIESKPNYFFVYRQPTTVSQKLGKLTYAAPAVTVFPHYGSCVVQTERPVPFQIINQQLTRNLPSNEVLLSRLW